MVISVCAVASVAEEGRGGGGRIDLVTVARLPAMVCKQAMRSCWPCVYNAMVVLTLKAWAQKAHEASCGVLR